VKSQSLIVSNFLKAPGGKKSVKKEEDVKPSMISCRPHSAKRAGIKDRANRGERSQGVKRGGAGRGGGKRRWVEKKERRHDNYCGVRFNLERALSIREKLPDEKTEGVR